VWKALDAELLRPWVKASGPLRITAAAIDAGYQTERVWRFCEARRQRRVIPTIGRDGRSRPLLQAPGPQKFKRSRASTHPLYIVGVDSAKDLLLLSRLRITTPGPGYVHFPETVDRVFFEQFTAERLVTVYRRGRPLRTWTKPQERRNEALDGTILAMAALALLGPATIAKLGRLAQPPTAPAPEPTPPSLAAAKAQALLKRGRGGKKRSSWIYGTWKP
jgi:phage terminase large subunit GpA-like protein